ncbi:hypothetical protein GOV06_01175 [Candidatus Woesearchaeota archaeon]|nr:hypothetical protein [Candidatus Woesearchaeota archaeon]
MSFVNKFKLLYQHKIVRRYIVTNAFDGALTILGILLAMFFAGIEDPRLIILPGIGSAIALGVSGVWGAYAAETSETANKMKELERHLLVKLGKSNISKKASKMAYFISFVNGTIPLMVSFLILSPFFIVIFNVFSVDVGYLLALIIASVILFLLGVFTGFTAKENMIKNGFKMLLAGVVIGAIFFILARLGLL